MTISPGSRLGPYEILAPLGAGGMGEVWRAKDTRLDRDVAIKVLPEAIAQNEQFLARFEREAKTISSLNHPNICTLHDVGEENGLHYLVMELVDGESLADRLTKGPMPLDQLTRYGGQIADALGRAHRQGIVHRDLKPGNIMLTKAGAKLLDFGLARSATETQPVQGMTEMPTQAKPLTAEGTILGTFQYMAPEQLEGVEADARTDIFALGTVLYEMATGNRAFDGKTKTSLIAAIVSSEPPPITEVRKMSPSLLDRVVRKCLEKDPDDRWQSAYDVASELRWIEDDEEQGVEERTRSSLGWIGMAFAAAAALVVGSLGTWFLAPRDTASEATRVVHASIEPPSAGGFAFLGDYAGVPVLSPDGMKVAFAVVGNEGVSELWVRDLASREPRLVPGTEGAYNQFWSPDSKSLGFFNRNNLLRVDLVGGAPRVLASTPQGKGGSWSRNGTIIFTPNSQDPIYAVPAGGGAVTQVTERDDTRHSTHRFPRFLSDGKRFLYFAASHRDPFGPDGEIWVGSVEEGFEQRMVLKSHAEAVVADGMLLTLSGSELMTYAFDESKVTVDQPPKAVGARVMFDQTTWKGAFSAAEGGLLAYVPQGAEGGFDVSWFDRSGNITPSGLPQGNYLRVELNREGVLAALEAQYDQPNSDIWVADLERGLRTRLAVTRSDQVSPTWTADGTLIYYGSNPITPPDPSAVSPAAIATRGVYRVYVRRADGAGGETLLHSEGDVDVFPWAVSPDGRWLLIARGAYLERSKRELVVAAADGKGPVWRFPGTEAGTTDVTFSPDGRWVAYVAYVSGREEVYVVPFRPTPDGQPGSAKGRWQISYDGGRAPRWGPDGRELFYVRGDNSLMVTPMELKGETVLPGRETELFQTPFREDTVSYDVAGDGERFLIATQSSTSRKPFAIVSGWPTLLGR